jgi:hypothetical protein
MKKLMIGFMLAVGGAGAGLTQTNFYTNVTNLWYQGYKSNVLNIANVRLAANSNDIAGLILKAEYHFAFLEVEAISNAYLRVLQVGDTITTTNFVKEWQEDKSRERILWILDDFAENPMTLQEIQAEKPKALINEKPLPDADLIEALQKDGYFD